MTRLVLFLCCTIAIGAARLIPLDAAAAQGASAGGTITGIVKLTGAAPGNPIIRMGVDPMCGQLNKGQRPIQQYVVVNDKGGLANAFVELEGTFPAAAPPSAPVTLTQKNCMYTPRVLGARTGGTLRVVDDDPIFHNIHSQSLKNPFNFSQQKVGMTRDVQLKGPDVMMRIGCDVHSWMVAWVGVVSHPYYAVSGADGAFTISNVPAGKRTIRVWHERFGELMQTVNVAAGQTAKVEFAYTGKEQPSKARVQELTIPHDSPVLAFQLVSAE